MLSLRQHRNTMAVCQTRSLMARSLWRIGKLRIKKFAFSAFFLSFTDDLVLALAGSAPRPSCVAFLRSSPSALHPNRPLSSKVALLCVNTTPDLCQDGRAVWRDLGQKCGPKQARGNYWTWCHALGMSKQRQPRQMAKGRAKVLQLAAGDDLTYLVHQL